MNCFKFIPFISLALALLAQGADDQSPFCLAPIRPPMGKLDFDILMRKHRAFEALLPSPEKQRCEYKIEASGKRGLMDMAIWSDSQNDSLNPSYFLVVRMLESDNGKIAGLKNAFEIKISDDLERALMMATDKILESTSYTSGSRAVFAMDGGAFEVSSEFMAGMCSDPPVNSRVGRVMALWVELGTLLAE
jgi:hypothetical protein